MVNRMQWEATKPDRQQKILRILQEKESYFTELYEKLGWGRQTLNLYLKELMTKGWVKREKRGRKAIYSLIPSNLGVRQMLGCGRVWTRGRIELNRLSGGELIRHWIHSINFTHLNIIQDYKVLGENLQDAKTINRYLEAHLSDLLEVTKYYGEFMAKRIRAGTVESAEIGEAMERLRQELMNYKG